MSTVKVTHSSHPVFGATTVLSNGLAELHVATDFGPRVLHCGLAGKPNLFFNDLEKLPLGEKYDLFNDQIILYGGHRLWISPEIVPRCYHPDNAPVTVTPVDNGARFTAAVERHNQIQKSITLTLEPNAARVHVSHTIRNVGLWDIQLAPWCITMLAPGGVQVMPMPNEPEPLLPNRNISLWAYSEMDDSRMYWGKKFMTLTQDASKANPFKLGYNNEAGWAAYFLHGQAFFKFFEPLADGFYPDNGCCFESYTNGKMIEMESLGEMVELAPDEFVTLDEEWELYPAEAFDPLKARDEEYIRKRIGALDASLVRNI
jgi:hypothetical protein